MKLNEKVAIVTGGGTGIGRAIAVEAARAGAKVIVASRNKDRLSDTVDEINAFDGEAHAVCVDINSKVQTQKMAQYALETCGRIDILVNNAATIHPPTPIMEMDTETWETVMNTNLRGYLYCTQAVVTSMIRQNHGKIVNITSMAALGIVTPGLGAYIISKTGIIGLTKVCAREFGVYNINVNAIAVGRVHTPITDAIRSPEEVQQYLDYGKKVSILGRNGTPEDIAALAVFLASDDASFMTGQVIHNDGGRLDRM